LKLKTENRFIIMIELLAVLLTILLGWLAVHTYRTSQGDLFHIALPFLLTYWFLYVLKFMGLKEILAARFSEELMVRGLLLAVAGLLACYLGSRSPLSRRLAMRLPRVPARWESGALFPYAALLFTVAVLGEAMFIGRSGGFEHFFSAARGAGDYQANTAYLYNLRWFSIPAATLILVEIFFNQLQGGKKLLGLFLIGLAIAYNLAIGQRSGLLIFGLTLAAAWFYAHRGHPRLGLRLALIFLPFYLAIGVVGLLRSEFHLNSSFQNTGAFFQQGETAVLEAVTENFFYTGSDPHDSHQEPVLYLSVLNAVPNLVDYDYGKPYLNYLVHWIPRLWWPDKPNFRLEGARRLESAMGTDLQGPVLTVLGYFHANLGLAGVIIGMFLTGVGLTAMYLWFRAQPGSLGALFIYLHLFLYGIGAVFCYGIFTGWDTILPFSLAPALGAFAYLRLTGRLSSADPERRFPTSAPRWPLATNLNSPQRNHRGAA
jgi:oligosaccharide repeat unit polymerase